MAACWDNILSDLGSIPNGATDFWELTIRSDGLTAGCKPAPFMGEWFDSIGSHCDRSQTVRRLTVAQILGGSTPLGHLI